ncbi:MAG TPA: helix-turn-helix domain-containing protein [Solirubrobacterales bacterium]|jgi:sugar diacid utilization regulator|nr:helix-turn-helix domain-containing protein [Solirubrobacterales bacterium]
MSATAKGQKMPANGEETGALERLAEAVESGAGLPAVARAAARVLDASVALIDRSSAVLAVAGASPDQERKLLSGGEGVTTVELRVADSAVGELRYRGKGAPDPAIARMVTTLLALELERSRSPEWESEEVAGAFVDAVLERKVTDRGDIVARAAELGADLEPGAGVLILRAAPRAAQTGEWRARVLTLALRALRSLAPGSLASAQDRGEVAAAEVAVIVPAPGDEQLARAATGLARELEDSLAGFHLTIGRSRRAGDPVDLYRSGSEARLAVNVGEAEGRPLLAFEDTGAYRLLLPAMSEDPRELERFYAETVEPLSAYDDQYETELVATVEAYLDNDGNVAATAKQLFTHRHTIRYRLERVRELCGHDVSATEGREKLGLGLKAMRVLGIASPRGPAMEPGAEAGKVPRSSED